jgi:hypothetical protein
MRKFLLSLIITTITIGFTTAEGWSAVGPQRTRGTHKQKKRAEISPMYKSKDIKALLENVVAPGDKIQVYSLWIDSLKLRVTQADQDRLAGKINDPQYDDYLDQIAKEIYKISKEAKKLGFDELADMWEGLAFQYTKSMDNLLKQ